MSLIASTTPLFPYNLERVYQIFENVLRREHNFMHIVKKDRQEK